MKIKLYHILITAFFIYSYNICAQSKPKRDTSKDRSAIVAQKKKDRSAFVAQKKKDRKSLEQATQKKKREVTKEKRNTRLIQIPKVTSYLRVNQLPYLKRNIKSYGGGEIFKVNTDGKDWTVFGLPIWCHLTKYPNSFYISFDSNSSHNDRSDWFKVKSGDYEVKIDIIQSGAPINISANFNYCILHHNISRIIKGSLEEKCLKISTNVSIKGAKDQKCLIVALITDIYNKNIKAAYGYSNYTLPSTNDVFTSVEVVPSTDDTQSFDIALYLPNNAMNLLKKKNTLRCHLSLFCENTGNYVSDAQYIVHFKTKGKRGKVKTKSL